MSTDKVMNLTIFTTDWAKEDRRSVKAYLNGKGDGRVLWWNINRWAHQHFWSKASLEKIMFCFHSRHQTLTLLNLEYRADVQEVAKAIQSEGVVAGIRFAISSACKTRFSEGSTYSQLSCHKDTKP
ncbi:hypothetical protein [Janthinobacterium sp. LB3P118]|uniref:hypothetical protein n=1 Tax=Janthinobacterium sp. LB3P118 TaxID=3424195 RepID=UPI003F23F82F